MNIPLHGTVGGWNTLLEGVPDVLHPLMWLEESAEIDEENLKLLKDMVVTPTNALEGVQWTIVAIGAGMMLAAVTFFILLCII